MPRNVRNFWIELDVDGRSPVATGPRRADGGFQLDVFMRDEGDIKRAVRLVGNAEEDGSLSLHVIPFDGQEFTLDANPESAPIEPEVTPFVRTRR